MVGEPSTSCSLSATTASGLTSLFVFKKIREREREKIGGGVEERLERKYDKQSCIYTAWLINLLQFASGNISAYIFVKSEKTRRFK